ncbi:dirigent protein 24-like [Rhododendron vialii]|uniref:dirigent protein 24-like n=1 Tax=Rhododendron vialii TaxID=182163 RepID=UPI00265E6811|nr:dirigent protein 24-like [Rhododendron vialii]
MSQSVGVSSKTMKFTFYLLLLALSLGCASSARILDEVDPGDASDDVPDVAPVTDPTTTLPSGQVPATTTGSTPVSGVTPVTGPATTLPSGPVPVVAPVATTTPDAGAASTVTPPVAPVTTTTPDAGVANTVTPPDAAPVAATTPTTTPTTGATVPVSGTTAPQNAPLSFFMHDILGGTHPSGRVVTGIVANSDVNNLPFSKPNSQVFPINGGVPLNSVSGVINNNNAPFLVGLNGSPGSTTIQNNGNNNVATGGNNLPFVSAGQLPTGLTLQQLMFGSITVVDNELTEGHELGSGVVGKAQGFYLASSLDGTSHTLVLTALFHGGDGDLAVDDTVSFFGIHRTGSPLSEIAVIGGTGKYENAKGYATIETLLNQVDQHTTDGVETLTQFSVYLTP